MMEFPIGLIRRQATALLGEHEPRPLALCGGCGSEFVQPQAWKEVPNGDLFLRLRCPECGLVTSGTHAHDRVAEYDRTLIDGKQAMLAHYEAVVRHNMEELLDRFRKAFELDLITAGDFERTGRSNGMDQPTLQVESVGQR